MREVIQVVEIQQPFCSRSHGVAPCTATGRQCYNTRSTCQDAANFDLTSLSLYFVKPGQAGRSIPGVSFAIPLLREVSTAPTKINIAGADPDAEGLGTRALCEISLDDAPHSDRHVDPYQQSRLFDPLTRGTFWTKWLARNKYRHNAIIKVYEGYSGEALSDMSVRTYFMQSVNADQQGVRVTGKDVLAQIEDRKAQAPALSEGELRSDIGAGDTTINVANAVSADYYSSGTVRIGDELITYTSTSETSDDLLLLNCTRGTDGSTGATHSAEDAVQQCLRYTSQRVESILSDLLTTHGGIDASYLDSWTTEADDFLPSFNFTTIITEPIGVQTLVSELQEQGQFYAWWDERAAKIRLKAIRGVEGVTPQIDDRDNIMSGLRIVEKPRERVSQVWIYYQPRSWTGDMADANNFAHQFVRADLESETDELYGEPSIRKIFSRWIPSQVIASTVASKIMVRYRETPRAITFSLDAKDRSNGVGDTLGISHFRDIDEFGEYVVRNWTITSYEEVLPGETVTYTAEDTTLYGEIFRILAGGSADYSGTRGSFIGDANGLLSDGTLCARIT